MSALQYFSKAEKLIMRQSSSKPKSVDMQPSGTCQISRQSFRKCNSQIWSRSIKQYRMRFSFQEASVRYGKKRSQTRIGQAPATLQVYQEQVVNPKVAAFCDKIERDYITHRGSHSSFQVHEHLYQPTSLSKAIQTYRQKKYDEREPTPFFQEQPKAQHKERATNADERRRNLLYKFRQDVKLVVKRLKQMRLSLDEVLRLELFNPQPYRFGKSVFEAVKQGNDTLVFRLLIQDRHCLFSFDRTLKTPLIWACIRGHPTIVQLLLEQGAPTIFRDQLHRSAVEYAILAQQQECLKLLLLHFATATQEEEALAKGQSEMRTMVELAKAIMPSLSKMPLEKRTAVFNDRLKALRISCCVSQSSPQGSGGNFCTRVLFGVRLFMASY